MASNPWEVPLIPDAFTYLAETHVRLTVTVDDVDGVKTNRVTMCPGDRFHLAVDFPQIGDGASFSVHIERVRCPYGEEEASVPREEEGFRSRRRAYPAFRPDPEYPSGRGSRRRRRPRQGEGVGNVDGGVREDGGEGKEEEVVLHPEIQKIVDYLEGRS